MTAQTTSHSLTEKAYPKHQKKVTIFSNNE